jgi:hypothetical protein
MWLQVIHRGSATLPVCAARCLSFCVERELASDSPRGTSLALMTFGRSSATGDRRF